MVTGKQSIIAAVLPTSLRLALLSSTRCVICGAAESLPVSTCVIRWRIVRDSGACDPRLLITEQPSEGQRPLSATRLEAKQQRRRMTGAPATGRVPDRENYPPPRKVSLMDRGWRAVDFQVTTLLAGGEGEGEGESERKACRRDLECTKLGAAARFQKCRGTSRLRMMFQINDTQTQRFVVSSTDSDDSMRGSTSTPGSALPALRAGRLSSAYQILQLLGSTAAGGM